MPEDRGGVRSGRAPFEESVPVGQGSPVGEERASSLQDVNRVLPKDQRRRMVVQVRIHADEPGTHCVSRLPLQQELDDLVGVPEVLLSVGMRRSLSSCPLADGLRIRDICDHRHQPLTEDVLK